MPVEVKGAKELAAFFRECPTIGGQATRTGLVKSSGRLRTYIRRAAPMKSGTLRKSIGSWVSKSIEKPLARVGLKTRYYFKTLEYGRKAHTRKGKPRKGSPQMSRFAFLFRTVASHEQEIMQMTVTEARKAFFTIAGKTAARLGAPIRIRGGR